MRWEGNQSRQLDTRSTIPLHILRDTNEIHENNRWEDQIFELRFEQSRFTFRFEDIVFMNLHRYPQHDQEIPPLSRSDKGIQWICQLQPHWWVIRWIDMCPVWPPCLFGVVGIPLSFYLFFRLTNRDITRPYGHSCLNRQCHVVNDHGNLFLLASKMSDNNCVRSSSVIGTGLDQSVNIAVSTSVLIYFPL